MPLAPPRPVRDLGWMIGFTPRVPYGCLGWHVAIQPGPASHAPVACLPPLLWCTSAFCPVLVLPAASAEAIARGGAVRRPPAIRMPCLSAWEQAVTLIVRRNQQARRHRRDYPLPPSGAPSRTAALSATLRLAQALSDVAGTASRKDPMRRESLAGTMPDLRASVPRAAPRTVPASTAMAVPAEAQDPIRPETAALSSLPVTLADPSGDRARSIPPAATMIASHPKDPMHRENAAPFRRSGPLRNGNPRGNPNLAPRCGARTRQGCPCKGPAMRNGRCRMHGGRSTGPRTAEGLARLRAARTRHGGYSAEARAFERSCRVLIRDTRVLLALAERPAENRPALDPDALHDALLPQAMLPSGPALPPSKQTDGKSPYAVRTALLDSPSGPGDLASSGLEFGPITALRPPHPTRQDPMRRERQPLRRPPAPRFALPSLAPPAGPLPGAKAAREHNQRP